MLDIHPSVLRNRDPILSVLRRLLPPDGVVVEVASGSGAHAAWFTDHLPELRWQPTEHHPDRLALLQLRRQEARSDGFLPPLALDASQPDAWPVDAADAVVCINMAHISPFGATQGLIRGAGRILSDDGLLYLYGPFKVGGSHTAPSNARFDLSLRAQDPAWGVRDLAELEAVAAEVGLSLAERVSMPANNFSLVFRRA